MIVKCDVSWKESIINYVGNNYPECLYLYLDFIKYGFEVNYVNTWVLLNDKKIDGIILKYHTGMHVYTANDNFEASEVCELINELTPDMICSRKDVIEKLSSVLNMTLYETEFGHIGKCSKVIGCNNINVANAEKTDFRQIAELLYQDEGIGASYELDELSNQMQERNKQGFVRNYVIKDSNKVICHVCTGAELGKISMISGVVTDIMARGKGHATNLLAYTCKELLEEGKEVYSVYYTDQATKLHHRVGFVDYCEFGKLFVNKR